MTHQLRKPIQNRKTKRKEKTSKENVEKNIERQRRNLKKSKVEENILSKWKDSISIFMSFNEKKYKETNFCEQFKCI